MRKYTCLLLLFWPWLLGAQAVAPVVTLEKQRLMVLPARGGADPTSIDSRVTAIVAGQAAQLKRFEVIDRNQLAAILQEQALQMSGVINDSELVAVGKLAAAPEALIVQVLNFGQKGVPPDEEEEEDKEDRKTARKAGLLGVIVKDIVDAAIEKKMEGVERYPNNIQTVLQIEVRKVNVETGHSLASFLVTAEHTGGNKTASLEKVLRQLRWQVGRRLRELYLLTSEVLEVRGNEVLLLLGSELGVKPGTLFEISTPATKRTYKDREVVIPGRSVGYVRVVDLSPQANRGRILRKWEAIQPGYQAVEKTGFIFSSELALHFGSQPSQFQVSFAGSMAPLRTLSGRVHFNLGTITDSRERSDFNFGFGLGLMYKLLATPAVSLQSVLTLPLDLVFRSDDNGKVVTKPLFAPRLGLELTLMRGPRRDLVLAVNYILASASAPWKYTEEKDGEPVSHEAYWDSFLEPEIKPQGLYFSIGFRFFSFDVMGSQDWMLGDKFRGK